MRLSKLKKVVVVGAGVGGLATAIRLSIKGYSVEVFESNSYVGGKLSQIESKNFRKSMKTEHISLALFSD